MRVLSLTHHGLGRLADGGLAPLTLPGEEVEPDGAGGWRVLAPSPERQEPPCPQFGPCGGCAVQHARDPFVARWKAGIVATALANQGLAPEIAGVATSPPFSRRRARLAGRRRRAGAVLGFHGRGSTAIVETPGCRILTPRLLALRPALVDLVALAASRAGEMLLTVTDAAGGLDLLVEGARPLDLGLREALARWAAGAGVARLSWGAEPVVQAAAPWVAMGRARVLPPPGAFLQPTAEGEAALVAAVRRALGGARRVLDLFAGCGTFALPLAEDAQVHAVEGDGAMTAALLAGARGAAGLRRVTATARDLFRRPLAGAELEGFDAAVIDPPRQGAEAQVAALAAARLPVIAYVSCNPASFARDARRLVAAGYGMAPPLVIDQFRWSAHVELVTAFRRR